MYISTKLANLQLVNRWPIAKRAEKRRSTREPSHSLPTVLDTGYCVNKMRNLNYFDMCYVHENEFEDIYEFESVLMIL